MHDWSTDRNVLKSLFFYLQPNDYIYVKPLKQNLGLENSAGDNYNSISLATTTFFTIKK
jgi:polysaccharide export outer membrane protein